MLMTGMARLRRRCTPRCARTDHRPRPGRRGGHARRRPGVCLGGNRRIANRTDRHRDVELPLAQSAQPAHARRGHATDHDPADRLRERTAGRALQQRRLRRHGRRRGPGHVQRARQRRQRAFSTSNSNTATVGADASGTVAAPTFTANGTAGSYTVTASSPYGSVSFSLTNTAAGIPARLAAIPLKRRSARVGGRFPQPLQVRVLDAGGNPVAGAPSRSRSVPPPPAPAAPAPPPAPASPAAAPRRRPPPMRAASPPPPALTANTAAGSFTATASVSSGGGGSGSESAGKAGAPTVTPVSFSLSNLAGKPTKIAPGVGSTQSTPAGSAFPIRLAVTVTDADKNPVPGALVTFSAPAPARADASRSAPAAPATTAPTSHTPVRSRSRPAPAGSPWRPPSPPAASRAATSSRPAPSPPGRRRSRSSTKPRPVP